MSPASKRRLIALAAIVLPACGDGGGAVRPEGPAGRSSAIEVEMTIEGDDWIESVRARTERDTVVDAGMGRSSAQFCAASPEGDPYLVRLTAPGAISDDDLVVFELLAAGPIPPGGSGDGELHVRFERRSGGVDDYPGVAVTIEMDVGARSGRFSGRIEGGDPGPVEGTWSCR